MMGQNYRRWSHLLILVMGINLVVWVIGSLYGSRLQAATPSASPFAQPLQANPCSQLIVNGDFESTGGWIEYSSLNTSLISDFPPPSGAYHSGTRGAYLADYNQARDYIAQEVTIPADATQVILRYWWQMETQESSLQAYDFLTVTVDAPLEQPLAVIAAHSNRDAQAIWQEQVVDLSTYKGRTIYLRFEATTDANRPTAFYLDDITLEVCRPATATATPTPTPTVTPTVTPTPTPIPVSGGETTLGFSPAAATLPLGASAPVTVNVVITNAVDLGGFEFTLRYDPQIVHVTGVRLGDFLGSTGRTVSSLPANIDNTAGKVEFGAFSFGAVNGPSGNGILAEIGFIPRASGTSPLHFAAAQVTNTGGNVLSLTLRSGLLTVSDCSRYDMDCDGDVDVVDIMTVAARWQCRQGDACYEPKYDLDASGRIDIVDIMAVAARWGCTRAEACYWGTSPLSRTRGLEAVISIPDTIIPVTGRPVAVPVRVQDAVNLGAVEVEANFNPRLLSIEGVLAGDFLGRTGRTVVLLPPRIDQTAGTVRFALFTYGTRPGVNGTGDVAYILVRPLSQGQVTPRITDAQVVDTQGQKDQVTFRIGTLHIVPGYPVHLPWLTR